MGLLSGIFGSSKTTVTTNTVQSSTQNIDIAVNPQIEVTVPTTHFISNIIETTGLTEAYAKFGTAMLQSQEGVVNTIEQSQKGIASAIEHSMQATGEQSFLASQALDFEKKTTEQFFTYGKKIVIGLGLAIAAYFYLRFK